MIKHDVRVYFDLDSEHKHLYLLLTEVSSKEEAEIRALINLTKQYPKTKITITKICLTT
jgi:hypothetical protein